MKWRFIVDATDALLAERAKTHGSYRVHAEVTQALKAVIEAAPDHKFQQLSPSHREALHMIVHKIGRIMAGNPDYNDHWDDIAGYAKLASEACRK